MIEIFILISFTFEQTSDAFLWANLACTLSGPYPPQEHWLTSQVLPCISIATLCHTLIATHCNIATHCHTLSSCHPARASLHATAQLIRGILSDKVKFPNTNQFIHPPFLLRGFNMGAGYILFNQCKLPLIRHKFDQRKVFYGRKAKVINTSC